MKKKKEKKSPAKPKTTFSLPAPLKKILRSWKLYAAIGILMFSAAAVIPLIPEEKVPPALEKVHCVLLTQRNRVIRKLHLPFSGYEDTFSLPNPGTDPVRLYFGPSPSIEKGLCRFLSEAVSRIDLCAYDIRLESVADTLIEARRRGVRIRVITDTDNLSKPPVKRMIAAGIPVKSDQKKSIMHNKFTIVDARYLWTGSYNYTDTGTERNDNNAIVLESPETASAYEAKFDEYWNGNFSRAAKKKSGSPLRHAGKITLRYAFSPADNVREVIHSELKKAKNNVDVMAFSFTDADLAHQLRELSGKGIRVRCLFDRRMSGNKSSRDKYLRKIGVRVFYSPNHTGKMHHKVIIIDEETVITGSYNYSRNAEYFNDENILVIHSPEIARLYTKEMNRCIKGTKGY